jgi:hypothetical protein
MKLLFYESDEKILKMSAKRLVALDAFTQRRGSLNRMQSAKTSLKVSASIY